MRREAILGDAVGSYFDRDPFRAVDATGVVIRTVHLAPIVGIYLPPTSRQGHAVVAVDLHANLPSTHQILALALGHYFLGHRAFDAYLYGVGGPLFADPVEHSAADDFALCFLYGAAGLEIVRAEPREDMRA